MLTVQEPVPAQLTEPYCPLPALHSDVLRVSILCVCFIARRQVQKLGATTCVHVANFTNLQVYVVRTAFFYENSIKQPMLLKVRCFGHSAWLSSRAGAAAQHYLASCVV